MTAARCALRPFIVPLAVAVLGVAAAQESIERPAHGFAVRRPAALADFAFKEGPGSVPGSFTVAFSDPQALAGTFGVSLLAVPAAGVSDPAMLREMTLATLKGDQYKSIEKIDVEVGGTKRPGLAVEVEAVGRQFRARLVYFAANDMGYLAQGIAPAERFTEFLPAVVEFFESLRLIKVDRGAVTGEMRLSALAERCGSEFRWAADWNEAARIARAERRLILAYARFTAGFQISDAMLAGPFMDQDVVAMIQERFIAVRLHKDQPTPLHEREVYGLSPTSFGTSLLVCRADGTVIGEEFTTNTCAIHDLLVRALGAERAREAGGRQPQGGAEAQAAASTSRGDLEGALRHLQGIESEAGRRLRADLYRRLRRGDEALRELAGLPAGAGRALDEARVLMGLGRLEEALAKVEEALAGAPPAARQAEARYYRGALLLAQGAKEEAAAEWRALAEGDPEERFAWKAAAMLGSTAFALGFGEPLAWPEREVLAALAPAASAPLPRAKLEEAQESAIRHLLDHQREDGSWISPTESASGADRTWNDLTTAITAIGARGLVAHRERAEVAVAIERALAYLARARAAARSRPDAGSFMEYGTYADAYQIRLLADAAEARLVGGQEALAVIDELVARLALKQKPGGGWSYYVTGDLDAAGPSNQSISFITAIATIALLRAEEAGAVLPDGLRDRALSCLERMRNGDGTYEYFLFHDHEESGRRSASGGVPGAAGRGPVCGLALVLGGRRERAELREMLDLFFAHQRELGREAGKTLMHCGEHGQGSHYVLFDYATCAHAIAALAPGERAHYRGKLLDALLELRAADGGFLDNPLLGRSYGAGMALAVFTDLEPPRRR